MKDGKKFQCQGENEERRGSSRRQKAQAGNSLRNLRDIRRGVTDRRTDGRTDPLIEMR